LQFVSVPSAGAAGTLRDALCVCGTALVGAAGLIRCKGKKNFDTL